MSVYKAISAVQSDLAKMGISKDKKNAQQGYNFRGIDDVYDAIAPILANRGLCILPRVLTRECVERQTKSGGVLFYVVVECEFDLVAAEDGSKHTIRTFGEAMDSGDKATNKAMSAAYKYAAFQTFCIPVDVEDADKTTPPEVKPKQEKKPEKKAEAKGNQSIITITEISHKDGEKDGKPWRAYYIHGDNGGKYGTFSETFADLATGIMNSGGKAIVSFTVGKFGHNMTGIEEAPNEQN